MFRILFITSLSLFFAQPSTAGERCEGSAIVDQIIEAAGDIKILLIGETHGTNEIPALVSQLVCNYASSNERVLLMLEMNEDITPRIQQFTSKLDNAAKETLFDHFLWKRERQDGRNSHAMFSLIEDVGKLRQNGLNVDVSGIDIPIHFSETNGDYVSRDHHMATNIKKYLASNQYDRLVLIIGSFHNRLKEDHSGPDSITEYLERDSYYTMRVEFIEGSGWFCGGPRGRVTCAEHTVYRERNLQYPIGQLINNPQSRRYPYHGLLVLPTISASPPAAF